MEKLKSVEPDKGDMKKKQDFFQDARHFPGPLRCRTGLSCGAQGLGKAAT